MTISFPEFLGEFFTNLPFTLTVILTLAVILVNGWTDAPNAIATCVSTRSMHPRLAIIMAAVFNLFGVFVMTLVNAKVAETISRLASFDKGGDDSLIALCAALFAIVLWATAAWKFGIPTSESHALIAGISGAAIALNGSFNGIVWSEWVKVIYGLLLSTFLGFGMGFLTAKLTEFCCRNLNRRKTDGFFKNGQIGGAAAMAFMHGAQDGQKFMGVFMLGMFLAKTGEAPADFTVPLWLMILCSATMALGTSIGGYRIIKAVGMDMVRLERHQGFAADAAAAGCLLISSLTGIPVSTTHTKTTAIMGVGASRRLSLVNWGIVKEMVLTWVLTFPGCGIIGFIMAKLFMLIF